jgi:hypothetical protein
VNVPRITSDVGSRIQQMAVTDPEIRKAPPLPDVLPVITIVELQPGQYRLETDGIHPFAVPSVLRMMADRTERGLVEGT